MSRSGRLDRNGIALFQTWILTQRNLQLGEYHWSVRTYGNGPRLLIVLHGFGEDGSIFSDWADPLGDYYTILAPDLPHHGNSTAVPGADYGPQEVIRVINAILEDRKDPYALVGHSFGGRILIGIWKQLSRPPEAVWLLAPDGLATKRMGLVGKLPGSIRKWIAQRIDTGYRGWIRLARRLHRLGLLDAFSVRYMQHHLSDASKRRRLMSTWIALPHFSVNRDQLLRDAREAQSPIHLVIGKSDPLIDWELLEDWLKKWPASRLHVLDAGHNLIRAEVAEMIRQGS